MIEAEQFAKLAETWRRFYEPERYYYQIGPFVVCLAFATHELAAKIIPAFQHLKLNAYKQADFTIGLWDDNLSAQKLPKLDWDCFYQNGYHGVQNGDVFLHYYASIRAISVFNAAENLAFYVVQDLRILPWWVSGSPLQVILHWWLRERGMQLTHTAAVGDDHGAVLLIGKGGSGKSTTSLSCLSAGLNCLGEDYCLLTPGNIDYVHSVYQSAKLTPGTRKLFPQYETAITNRDTCDSSKALVFYQQLFPQQIKTSLPIKAIISLSVGKHEQALMTTCDQKTTLKNLMMSTLAQLPIYQSETMKILQTITARQRCFALQLGHDRNSNVAQIKTLLNECSS